MLAKLPPAPEYLLARSLIAHLREDELLRALVLEEPFDKEDQFSQLSMSMQSYTGALAVAPQAQLRVPHAESKTGVMEITLVILVIVSSLSMDGAACQAENLAKLSAQSLRTASKWMPSIRGIPYLEPKIQSVAEASTAELPELEGSQGRIITLTQTINYTKNQ